MNVPKGFKPKQGIEEKTDQLMKGPTIHKIDDLDLKIEESMQKKGYSYVIYEGLTFSEVAKGYYLDENYWMLACKFRYEGKRFCVSHVNDPYRHIIYLTAKDETKKHVFKKTLRKILKYNKKKGNNPKWDGKIILDNIVYKTDFKLSPSYYPFHFNFERSFLECYRKEFQDAEVENVVLKNVNEKELEDSVYPMRKITNKIDKDHPRP